MVLLANSALGGGVVQLAAFVQDRTEQQQLTRSSCSTMRQPVGARSAAAVLVVAGACCPPRPRSGRLQAVASKGKTRRRRSSSGDGGGPEDWDGSMGWPCDAWSSVLYGGAGGGDGGSSNGGSGGWHSSWGSAGGGDAFPAGLYGGMWLWQLLCAASLLRSLYFLALSGSMAHVDAATAATNLPQVALAC